MDLEEIDITTGNWVDSSQDREYWRALVNVALKECCLWRVEKEHAIIRHLELSE